MENDRRQFLRGAWLRSLERVPTPEGTTEIASVVVHARPENLRSVRSDIEARRGLEVAAEDPRGKLVILIEAGPGDRLGETLSALSAAEGVLSATLIYHAVDGGAA